MVELNFTNFASFGYLGKIGPAKIISKLAIREI